MPESASRPIVSSIGLVKEFKDFWGRPKAKAVNDIDFEVSKGEVLGLLGPNGSGKSTTVKMILGLLYPTGGRLTVFDRSPRDVETKRLVGYLPEESYLYKYLTAFETLDFFGSLFNLSAGERRKRSEQLLEMVGLTHAMHRQVGEFSKGMARRIGLAQAMINDPSFLILDEPTSGLDPLGCREVKDLILLLKKRGKTVLVTSHLLSDVEDVCDRVIILYGGKIRATGAISDLLAIKGQSRITTPSLTPQVMERILAMLKDSLSGEQFKVDSPRMTLEEFFLEVVSKAKSESIETSGALSGGPMAEYLSADTRQNVSADELLSGLASPEREEPPAPEMEPQRKVDEALLESLSVETPASQPSAVAQPDTLEIQEVALDEANRKLKDILSSQDAEED